MRALLVEDDAMLADGLREAFARAGYGIDHLGSAESALGALALTAYDVLLVDIGLPGMDGLSLVERIRARGHAVPVLMLTARDALEDRVQGLNLGADDYLVKPFAMPELLARVQALVRRSQSAAQSTVTLGLLRLDIARHEAHGGAGPLQLTGREWTLLEALMLATPKVLSKDRLADSLSRWDREITPNAVEIYVSRLRGKLKGSGATVRTVRGVGYRLEEEPS